MSRFAASVIVLVVLALPRVSFATDIDAPARCDYQRHTHYAPAPQSMAQVFSNIPSVPASCAARTTVLVNACAAACDGAMRSACLTACKGSYKTRIVHSCDSLASVR
jgi:hypothetical protein